MPSIRVGISGWTYVPWRGVFFPRDLPQSREFEFATRSFNSIEVNGTFYSLQRPSTFTDWYDRSPDGFIFAIKAGRYITHMRKLRDCEVPLANFFAQGLLNLREKLGPFLWQLPPMLSFKPEVIEPFLAMLPRTHGEIAKLAAKHDKRLAKRDVLETDLPKHPVRHAMEVRHESFRDEAFIKLLRKHNVALVVADTAGRWPFMEDVTADFVYARLHGDEELYASGYSEAALDTWASKMRAWSGGKDAPGAKLTGAAAGKRSSRDVYAYFDNDVKVHAPFDANGLARRLKITDVKLTPHADLASVDEQVRAAMPAIGPRGRRPSAKARSMAASRIRVTT